jgi:dUTP pyrophosphatase
LTGAIVRGRRHEIIIEPLVREFRYPERATLGSAGYDVRAVLRDREIIGISPTGIESISIEDGGITVNPGVRVIIPLGFKATLPNDVEAQIRIRSSVSFSRGLILPNSPATIDPDYPDEWTVLVANISHVPARIEDGERFAQIVFHHFESIIWRHGLVTRSTDRAGGLGSTGHE